MPHTRRQWIASAVTALLTILMVSTFRVAVVHGSSMAPTFVDGQMVVVSRILWPRGIRRGNVVLIRRGNSVLIKRVFRLPGEVLDRKTAARFTAAMDFFEPTGKHDAPLRVPKGQIVVLGDNLAVSDDSREFGPVPLRDVLGKVLGAPPPS
ncbi:MAG: signal peptidase I [Chthonomonadales bacterium]